MNENDKRLIDKVNEAIPNYPGRATAERLVGVAIAPFVRAYSKNAMLRTLGYVVLWQALEAEGVEDPKTEIFERGWVSRTQVFQLDRFVRIAFGCDVKDFAALHQRPDGRLRLIDGAAGSGPGAEATESPPASD